MNIGMNMMGRRSKGGKGFIYLFPVFVLAVPAQPRIQVAVLVSSQASDPKLVLVVGRAIN